MKKLLAIIVSALMIFSIFMVSACDENAEDGPTSNVGFVFSSNSDGGFITFSSTEGQEDSSVNQYSAEEYSAPASTTPVAPTVSVSGNAYVVPQTTVDPTLSANVQAAVRAINNIGTIAYSDICKNKLEFAQAMITAAGGGSNVPNYSDYTSAKASYDSFAVQVSQVYVDNFKTAVQELGAFEYTQGYKTKLDQALAIYNEITPSLQSSVSTEYGTLNTNITLYSDTTVINEFMTFYATVEKVTTNLTATNKGDTQRAVNSFTAMTAAQKSLIATRDSTVESTISTLKTYINATFPEARFSVDANGSNSTTNQIKIGSTGKVFKFKVSSPGDKSSKAITFSDGSTYTSYVNIKTTNTFTAQAPYSGTLLLYLAGSGTVTINGTSVEVSAEGVIGTFTLSSTSAYQIAVSASNTVSVYAAVFS